MPKHLLSPIVRKLSTCCRPLASIVAAAAACGVASAADIQKDDNTNSLNLTTSWVGGVVPGSGDVAVWGSALTADRSNAIGTNQSWAGIKVTTPGGSTYTIANTASSTLTIGASGIDMSSATANLTISAILNLNTSQTWTVGSGRTLTLSSASNSGSGTISITGSGTVSINNAGSILGSGMLSLGGGINLTGNTSRTLSNQISLTGNIGVGMTSTNLLTFAGGLDVGSGTRTITLSNASGGTTVPILSFTGGGLAGSKAISGSGQLIFANGNAGSSPVAAVRMGTNGTDYPSVQADVTIGSNVEVYFQTAQVFTADSDLTIQSGGVFNMSNNGGSSASQTIGSLAGSGTVSNERTSGNQVAVLTIDGGTSTGTTTFSGNIITGSGTASVSVTKQGNTTQIFSGSNGYYGQTLVNAGTLLVNGSHVDSVATAPGSLTGFSGSTAGHFQVASGATLGGSGLIAGNNAAAANTNMVLVQSGGVLAPGSGTTIGTLKLDGGNIGGVGSRVLSMASGAKFAFDLSGSGGTADQVAFWNYTSGDFLLSSNQIDLSLSGAKVAGTYTVTLFSFYSNSGTTLTSSGITSGLTIGSLGAGISGTPTLSYNAGGNTIDLTYTVVPEPRDLALIGLGLGFLLWRRSRRVRA